MDQNTFRRGGVANLEFLGELEIVRHKKCRSKQCTFRVFTLTHFTNMRHFFLLTFFLSTAFSNAQSTVGHADVNYIFRYHPLIKHTKTAVEEYQDSLEATLTLQRQELNAMLSKYMTLLETDSNAPALDEMLLNIGLKEQAYLKEKKAIAQQLKTFNAEMVDSLNASMAQSMAMVAKENKLSLLLSTRDKEEVPLVLVAPASAKMIEPAYHHVGVRGTYRRTHDVPLSPNKTTIAIVDVNQVLVAMPAYLELKQKVFEKKAEGAIIIQDAEAWQREIEQGLEEMISKNKRWEFIEKEKERLKDAVEVVERLKHAVHMEAKEFERHEMREVMGQLQQAIEAVAQEQRIDYVFSSTESGGLPFVLNTPEQNDLTHHVMSKLASLPEELPPLRLKKGVRVGVVHLNVLLRAIPGYDEAMDTLKRYSKLITQEARNEVQETRDKVQTLEELLENGRINSNDRYFVEKELRLLKEELELVVTQLNAHLAEQVEQKRLELIAPFLQHVKAAIDEIVQEKGMDYIVNASSQMSVLWVDDESVLDEEVLEKLSDDQRS